MKQNILAHKYHSRTEFIADVELIAKNCEQYNGTESIFTERARLLVEFTRKALDEVFISFQNQKQIYLLSNPHSNFYCKQFGEHCAQLEQNIALVQERAKKEAEIDEIWGDDETDDRLVSI